MANDIVKFGGNPISVISNSITSIATLISDLEKEREKTARIEIEADFYKQKEIEMTKKISKKIELDEEREKIKHKEAMEKLSIERDKQALSHKEKMKEYELKEDKLNMISKSLDKTDLTNPEIFNALLKNIVEL